MFSAPNVPETMRGMTYDSHGPGRLYWHSRMKLPQPGSNQVLVRVISASMNPADFRITEQHGPFYSNRGSVVGQDFAGIIVALGKGVQDFAIGDKVFGLAPGYATYTVASTKRIVRILPGMDVNDFGVYGFVGVVAHQILCKHWLDRGEYNMRNLMVIGASGGVGSSVIQIARALGGPEVTITGVASHKNCDYVKSLGANQAVDYTRPGFEISKTFPAHSMDLIVDLVSGTSDGPNYIESAMQLLKPSGRYVAMNSTSSMDWMRAWLTDRCGCNVERSHFDLFSVNKRRPQRDLEAVARLVAQKKFKLHISQQVPLTETPIRRALHVLKQGHSRGKIEIKPEHFGLSSSYT